MIWKERGDIWIGSSSMEESSPVSETGKGHIEEIDAANPLCLGNGKGICGSKWERNELYIFLF